MSKILKEALEKIDESILPQEAKETILEDFNKAIDEKVEAQLKTKLDEALKAKETEYSESLDEMMKAIVESYKLEQEKEINEKVEELSKEYANTVKEATEASYESEIKAISEKLERYVEASVKTVVESLEPTWNNEVEVAKANAVLESFKTLTDNFGIDFAKVTTPVDEAKEKLQESYDKALVEAKEKDEYINSLEKQMMIKEAIEGCTALEADKLSKLLESVDFKSKEKFNESIVNYKTLVKGSKVDEVKKIEEKVEEPSKTNYVPSYLRGKK